MIYKNQFVICNKLSSDIIDKFDLKVIKLNSNRYLYFKDLNYKIFDKNENSVILIGFCVQSDPSKKQNLEDIFNNQIDDIEIELSTLVGNYVIIYKDMIYKDIGNLHKLFLYNSDEKLISNNALVFKNLLNLDLGTEKKFGGHKFRYCPPGKSCFSMISTLYNSQIINIYGKIFHNKLVKNKVVEKLSLNEFVKMHAEYCCQIVSNLYKNLKENNKKLFLTLTGGRDSRMILAVCLYLKIPFEVVTLYIKVKENDLIIAKEICEKYNLKQTIIDFDKFKVKESKKEELKNVIGNEFFEKDNEIIEKEVFESFMNDGDCIIFGNGPEWASLTYAPCCDNINCKEYSKYKDWIEKNCEKSLPLKIRLFLEVRVGSWLSSIQHSYDMCSKIQRFSFPISEKIIANSLSFDTERNKFAINQGVIQLLTPELNNIRYE